jgi:hypothetical protein
MSFDVGQKVVCVDDRFDDWVLKLYTALPKKDAVYVVRDVRIGVAFEQGKRNGAVSILLVGMVNPPADSKAGLERGFNAERFRSLDWMKEMSGLLNRKIDEEAQKILEWATKDMENE